MTRQSGAAIPERCPRLIAPGVRSAVVSGVSPTGLRLVDQFGTVARTAFDASGKRLGTQVGTYRRGAPNGMVVEMTYLEPDADHPLGQAFDGAGNPMPMHTGPDMPIDRGMAGRVPILPVPYRDFRRVLEVRQIFFDLRVGRSVFTSPVGVGR